MFSSINAEEVIAKRASTVASKNVLLFQEEGRLILGLGGLPQLSRHSMLRDGERGLGSHQVVAGVVAVSAHLTQDAGRAHAGREQAHKQHICIETHKAAQRIQIMQKTSMSHKLIKGSKVYKKV